MRRATEECNAGIDGGCGACVKCDPEWWERLGDCEIAAARLANLGACLAIAGILQAIRAALDYSLADLPTQGRLPRVALQHASVEARRGDQVKPTIMFATEIVTRRYVVCPGCGANHEFCVEHLFDDIAKHGYKSRDFGPWYCHNEECDAVISGVVNADGTVEIKHAKREHPNGLALLKLGDLWLVVDELFHGLGDPDFFYHSHQCPANLLRRVRAVFGEEFGEGGKRDPHGRLRYVASIEATKEARDKLDNADGLEELFSLFGTDGTPPESAWPEANAGLIPLIAQWRREAKARH